MSNKNRPTNEPQPTTSPSGDEPPPPVDVETHIDPDTKEDLLEVEVEGLKRQVEGLERENGHLRSVSSEIAKLVEETGVTSADHFATALGMFREATAYGIKSAEGLAAVLSRGGNGPRFDVAPGVTGLDALRIIQRGEGSFANSAALVLSRIDCGSVKLSPTVAHKLNVDEWGEIIADVIPRVPHDLVFGPMVGTLDRLLTETFAALEKAANK